MTRTERVLLAVVLLAIAALAVPPILAVLYQDPGPFEWGGGQFTSEGDKVRGENSD